MEWLWWLIAVLIGYVVGYAHWREIRAILYDTLTTTLDVCATLLKGAWHAVRVFLEISHDGVISITRRLYYRRSGGIKIRSKVLESTVAIEDLPADLQAELRKRQGQEIEVTDEIEKLMDLKLT